MGARAGLGRSEQHGNIGPSGGTSGARRPTGARREEGRTRGVLGARDNLGKARAPREGAGA
jgi:hypothetical protein